MKKSLGANTLATPTPAWIVCAYDAAGKANGATVAWAGICSSGPPSLCVSLRKPRHTYGGITHSKAFTMNIPAQSQASLADYFGIVSGRNTDKFAVSGLTPVRSDLVNAPYIAEFPLVVECELIHVFELGEHTQFVGEIKDVKAEEEFLDAKGAFDLTKAGMVVYNPFGREYYGLGPRLGQAFSMGKVHAKG